MWISQIQEAENIHLEKESKCFVSVSQTDAEENNHKGRNTTALLLLQVIKDICASKNLSQNSKWVAN